MRKVLSTTKVKALFGDPPFTRRSGSRWVTLDADWRRQHLTTVQIPELAGVESYGGRSSGRITVHHAAAGLFQQAFAAVGASEAHQHLQFFGGSFAPRLMTGSRTRLSRHSWGIAIDLNCNGGRNGYNRPPEPAGSPYSMHEIAAVFDRFGFAWGGEWKHPDAMHLEVAVDPQSFTPPAPPPAVSLWIDDQPADVVVSIRQGVSYASIPALSAALGVAASGTGSAPIGQFARAYGWDVTWDADSKRVVLTRPEPAEG